MELRELDWNEINEIYERCLTRDFIPQEQKPLNRIRQLHEAGNYPCFGLFENGELRVYAFLASAPGTVFLLLDYLAVREGYRDGGYGGQMLEKLKEKFADRGLILEVENGSDVLQEEEKEICRKRISFYERHGVRRASMTALLWGKALDIYYLISGEQKDNRQKEIRAGLKEIYETMYTEEERARHVQLLEG